jgi:putative ABC transport system permease protein
MFANYFKTAIRNIIHYRGYSMINIVGLAVGLAVFIAIMSIVDFHLSFDDFHADAGEIYSVIQVLPSDKEDEYHTARIPAPLLPFIRDELPEIESSLRWIPTERWIVRHNGQKYYAEEGTVWAVDPNFFSFFSFELLSGDPMTALADPQSIVLTQTIAQKYFGEENPLGKKLTLGGLPDFIVTGVARDVPLNSSLPFDSLVSLNSFGWQKNWRVICASFVKIAAGIDHARLKQKLYRIIEKHGTKLSVPPIEIYLQPLSELYLESPHIRGLWRSKSRFFIYLNLTIGIVLLAVVCLNFINLATTQYMTRAKEVAVRKAVGGTQTQLRWQFLGESVLLTLIAFPLALVIYEIINPSFIFMVTDDPTRPHPGLWDNPRLFIELVGVTALVGILAGCYPAIFLSRLDPIQILKGRQLTGKKGTRLRQVLVVTQFAASIFAVLVALSTFKYFQYLSTLDLGFEKENVLVLDLGRNYHNTGLRPIKEDLMRHPNIELVAAATWIPINWNYENQVIKETQAGPKSITMNAYGIDYDFIELLKMEIIEGRSFSPDRSDGPNYIINETAAKVLNWKYPIGKKLTYGGRQGVIVGVVKDFHFKNLSSKISPSIFYLHFNYLNVLYIKISEKPVSRVLNFIDNRLQFFEPDLPFNYTLLDQRLNETLRGMKKWTFIAGAIGGIAIFFSCLGLVGLASHSAQIRTKEIGIRKAHGASAAQIIGSLLIDFIRLIIIAILITFPLFYAIDKILTKYLIAHSANTGFEPYTYALAGLLALLSGFVAVLLQTTKVARANPVESLRYE